ncbi:MAG: hypothetical protein K0U98_07400 [Deltaproteobacteria bacterium]|nr:hypothetical protein [Deltaproteobacteria bacterium]
MVGYSLSAEPERAGQLRSAYRRLMDGEPPTEIRQVAETLLLEEEGFHPAQLLIGQSWVVEGRYRKGIDALLPLVEEVPDYEPARLSLGRAAELGDAPLVAFEAFSSVADTYEAAAGRVEELRPRALEILHFRFQDAIDRGRLEVAANNVGRLQQWASDEWETLAAIHLLSQRQEDPSAELAVLQRMVAQRPEETSLLHRQAQLEVEIGDPSRGVALLRSLAAANPQDSVYTDSLERAEFSWRLSMLPQNVKDLVALQDLGRGQYASMLYWLVPGIRHGRGQSGRIATDILDHPDREAIARVLSLGFLDVDERLHRFQPDREISRLEVLEALLRFLGSQNRGISCLGKGRITGQISTESVCRKAASCALLPGTGDCLPQASLSGGEALEFIRLSLRLLTQP